MVFDLEKEIRADGRLSIDSPHDSSIGNSLQFARDLRFGEGDPERKVGDSVGTDIRFGLERFPWVWFQLWNRQSVCAAYGLPILSLRSLKAARWLI
jgi:hypothetical protein